MYLLVLATCRLPVSSRGGRYILMYDYANYNSALCTLCRLSSRPQVLPGWNQDKSGLQWMVKIFFFPSLSLTLKLLTTKLWQSPNDFHVHLRLHIQILNVMKAKFTQMETLLDANEIFSVGIHLRAPNDIIKVHTF